MKILIIQTAFIGDVILATPLAEKLHEKFPQANIDILVRKGNESLFKNHPFIRTVLIWEKKKNKFRNLFGMIGKIRKEKYDRIYNLHRFASSGFITILGGAKRTYGFTKNPLSGFFSERVKHEIGNGKHEVQRNLELAGISGEPVRPALYPSEDDYKKINVLITGEYYCIAPASVWFTKQFPVEKWIEIIHFILKGKKIFLLGGPGDHSICEQIIKECPESKIENLAGKLSFLESAALMKTAAMNYVNDSAPLHIASAVNANVRAVFCSTVPEFGFGPLSDNSKVIQTTEFLPCKPCGLHGYKACPLGHFRCALTISPEQFL